MFNAKPKNDHIAFQVSNLDDSIDFYADTLGLNLLSRTVDEKHHEAFAFLELEGGNIELLQLLDDENKPISTDNPPPTPPYCPHLAIAVDDIDECVRILREKSVAILKGPLEIPGNVKWLYVADPDANIIEFVEWLK